jgi:hypothetical protein
MVTKGTCEVQCLDENVCNVTEEDNLFYSTAHANREEVTDGKRCRKEL